MTYLVEEDIFQLRYYPALISLEQIFEKIEALGEQRNLPYKSFVNTTK